MAIEAPPIHNPTGDAAPQGELQVEVRGDTGACVVELRGALDVTGAAELEERLGRLLGDTPGPREARSVVVEGHPLVLDLSGVTFVDSSGLKTVLRLYGRCLALHQELVLCPGPPSVQRVFALTRAADVLPFREASPTIA